MVGTVFCQKVSIAYDEIVHWRHNLFQVPYGWVGSDFGQTFFHSYGKAGALEAIAITTLKSKETRYSIMKRHS